MVSGEIPYEKCSCKIEYFMKNKAKVEFLMEKNPKYENN
jgi:hypothetical protein